jgi:hypothetical protein
MPPQNKKPDENSKAPHKDHEDRATCHEEDPLGHTAVYKKDPKTGLWIVKNPSGSIAYNYLYRDNDFEQDNDK